MQKSVPVGPHRKWDVFLSLSLSFKSETCSWRVWGNFKFKTFHNVFFQYANIFWISTLPEQKLFLKKFEFENMVWMVAVVLCTQSQNGLLQMPRSLLFVSKKVINCVSKCLWAQQGKLGQQTFICAIETMGCSVSVLERTGQVLQVRTRLSVCSHL